LLMLMKFTFRFPFLALGTLFHWLLRKRDTPGDWLSVVTTHRTTAEGAKSHNSSIQFSGQFIRCVVS
jgi:hypothetical protein